MEAVFRYNPEGIYDPLYHVVCLSWGYPYDIASEGISDKSDPSDEFISRFDGNQPPVKKLSECDLSNNYEDEEQFCFHVVDKESGEDGVIFQITTINWISSSKVEVEGGYHSTCAAASGNLYTVVLEDDSWVVIDDVVLWVS